MARTARLGLIEAFLCLRERRRRSIQWVSELEAIGGDVEDALERVRVPAYVIGPSGTILWVNAAARKLVGDVRGLHFTAVVAPEEKRRAREIFFRNLLGPSEGSDNTGVVIGADGDRVAIEVSAVPLRSGERLIGVFGQVLEVEEEAPEPPHPHLTARQSEVLRLLEHGHSTKQIAEELHLSIETVRNHVRAILRALGVHSRIEAVAVARQQSVATG